MLLREDIFNGYFSILNRICQLHIVRCYHTLVLMCDGLKIFLNCLDFGKEAGYVHFILD